MTDRLKRIHSKNQKSLRSPPSYDINMSIMTVIRLLILRPADNFPELYASALSPFAAHHMLGDISTVTIESCDLYFVELKS